MGCFNGGVLRSFFLEVVGKGRSEKGGGGGGGGRQRKIPFICLLCVGFLFILCFCGGTFRLSSD